MLDMSKIDIAKRVLLSFYPWWDHYIQHLQFHSMPEGEKGVWHCDPNLNVFLNDTWVAGASVNEIAGCINYCLNMTLRRFDLWFSPKVYTPDRADSKYIHVAASMEVSSALKTSPMGLDKNTRERCLAAEFTPEMLSSYHIDTSLPYPPGIWFPHEYGLPDEKSAKHYLSLLMDVDQGLQRSATPDENGELPKPEEVKETLQPESETMFDKCLEAECSTAYEFLESDAAPSMVWAMEDHSDIHQVLDREEGEIGITQGEWDQIMAELSRDVSKHMHSPGVGRPGSFIIRMADTIVRKKDSGWRRKLLTAMARYATGASQSGMVDMSYSKRNNNQKEGMPLMPGLIMHPAKFMVLIDVSASMSNDLQNVMPDILDIVTHVMARFGEPVTYVCADTEIQYATTMMIPSHQPLLPKKGTGGTQGFGEILKEAATKGVRYKGRRWLRPDMLFVFTDGCFDWPWANTPALLRDKSQIMVGCTTSYHDLNNSSFVDFPRWLHNNENFFHITDDRVK